MINEQDLRAAVIEPSLFHLSHKIHYSMEAEDLLIVTAAVESNLGGYLKQVNGPAVGIYQMEPATWSDIYHNYLEFPSRKSLCTAVNDTCSTLGLAAEEMVHNLMYATCMARVHYYRVPEPLPVRELYQTKDLYINALVQYWKKYYNTSLGKGDVDEAFQKVKKFTSM